MATTMTPIAGMQDQIGSHARHRMRDVKVRCFWRNANEYLLSLRSEKRQAGGRNGKKTSARSRADGRWHAAAQRVASH